MSLHKTITYTKEYLLSLRPGTVLYRITSTKGNQSKVRITKPSKYKKCPICNRSIDRIIKVEYNNKSLIDQCIDCYLEDYYIRPVE